MVPDAAKIQSYTGLGMKYEVWPGGKIRGGTEVRLGQQGWRGGRATRQMAEAELPGLGDQLHVRIKKSSRLGDQVKGDVLSWDRKGKRTGFKCDC